MSDDAGGLGPMCRGFRDYGSDIPKQRLQTPNSGNPSLVPFTPVPERVLGSRRHLGVNRRWSGFLTMYCSISTCELPVDIYALCLCPLLKRSFCVSVRKDEILTKSAGQRPELWAGSRLYRKRWIVAVSATMVLAYQSNDLAAILILTVKPGPLGAIVDCRGFRDAH